MKLVTFLYNLKYCVNNFCIKYKPLKLSLFELRQVILKRPKNYPPCS